MGQQDIEEVVVVLSITRGQASLSGKRDRELNAARRSRNAPLAESDKIQLCGLAMILLNSEVAI